MRSNDKQLRGFGNFRIDLDKKILWHEDEPVHLPSKAVEVLCVLVGNQGEIITKEELLDRVWNGSFVEESVISQNIHHIRKTLKDLNFQENSIQTIPRRGYRFVGDVYETDDNLVIEREIVDRSLLVEISEDSLKDLDLKNAAKIPKTNPASYGFRLILASVFSLSLLSAGFVVWQSNQSIERAALKDIKSVAVLPLQNLTENEKEKTLSLGLTDALISKLGGLNRFTVRPYSATQKYQAGETDAIGFGKALKVDAVLEGSLQTVNNRMRVNIRLLRVGDGSQIWAGSFDENEIDIFKLQDSISAQVADSLIGELLPKERQLLASRPTEDLEAYKLYLRARHAWNKRTSEGFEDSIRLFQAAIDRDPTFALAYAGLADAYVLLNDYDAAAPEEAYPKAKAAAFKALEIDPNLSEPRTTLAYVIATHDWNFPEAEREYRRSIETNPNSATAHQWYGEMLYTTRRFAEAESHLKRAVELDPLAPIVASELAVVSYYSGKYDVAIEQFSKIKQEYPSFPTSYMFLAWSYEQKQMPDQAFDNEIIFWELKGVDADALTEMERAFRQVGYTAYLRQNARMLEMSVKSGRLFAEYRLAHVYARLQDREKTLEWVEKGIERRSANIIKANLDPNFRFLRDDERFQRLLSRFHQHQ